LTGHHPCLATALHDLLHEHRQQSLAALPTAALLAASVTGHAVLKTSHTGPKHGYDRLAHWALPV
jgi:hypothetical protein